MTEYFPHDSNITREWFSHDSTGLKRLLWHFVCTAKSVAMAGIAATVGSTTWSRTRDRRQCTHNSDGERRQEATAEGEERKEGEGKLGDMVVHPGAAGGRDGEER